MSLGIRLRAFADRPFARLLQEIIAWGVQSLFGQGSGWAGVFDVPHLLQRLSTTLNYELCTGNPEPSQSQMRSARSQRQCMQMRFSISAQLDMYRSNQTHNYLPIYISIHPSIPSSIAFHPSLHPSHPSIHPSVYLWLSIFLSLDLSICLSLYLYVSLSVSLCLSLCLSLALSLSSNLCLCICLCVDPSVRVSILISSYASRSNLSIYLWRLRISQP